MNKENEKNNAINSYLGKLVVLSSLFLDLIPKKLMEIRMSKNFKKSF